MADEIFVQDLRSFQLWAYGVVSAAANEHGGVTESNRFYDGVTQEDPPASDLFFRTWLRNFTSRPYSFGPDPQKRRCEAKGAIYMSIKFPVSRMDLLQSAWDLGILAQSKFRRRDHPCGIICREVNIDPVGVVSGEVYYQLLLTARYEFDEFI